MTLDWNQPGYPERHHVERRRARRYAVRAMVITGAIALALVLNTLYGATPPWQAALALAIFLLFGVFGGLGAITAVRKYVRAVPYFQRDLGGIITYTAGEGIARHFRQLDALAEQRGVRTLSSFGFNDDYQGETLVWHAPREGLQTVETLLAALDELDDPAAVPDAVRSDLVKWRRALAKAASEEVSFCVLLLH